MRKDTLLHGDLCSFKKYHLKTLQLVTHDRLIWTTYSFIVYIVAFNDVSALFFWVSQTLCFSVWRFHAIIRAYGVIWGGDFGELCYWCRYDLDCWTFNFCVARDLNFNETVQAGVGISSNFCETCWRIPSARWHSIIGGHWVGFWQLCGHLWALCS